ncbi:MAG: hypothetical protein PWQ57_2946 [Desulfovibrionales bacterium]|nr:hypothetical protein [Desulfovibrionales bacterium]
MPYWGIYILLEALNKCNGIEKYLDIDHGKKKFICSVENIGEKWIKNYAKTFDRISLYRTLISRYIICDCKFKLKYGDILNYILNATSSAPDDLLKDMETLLAMDRDWRRARMHDGINAFDSAIESLRYDMYCLFCMLCSSKKYNAVKLFAKFDSNLDDFGFSNLHDVLQFEEIKFKRIFILYVPHYLKDTHIGKLKIDWECIYDDLYQFNGFEAWIRAFSDMHHSLNKNQNLRTRLCFEQPRLLDHLLVMTIRTEIILRSIVERISGQDAPDGIKDVIENIAKIIITKEEKQYLPVFDGIKSKIKELTSLRNERLINMFENIKSDPHGTKNWKPAQRETFEAILTFIKARNYFAHHSFNDNELANNSKKLPNEVLTACLFTVIKVHQLVHGP